MYSPTLMVNLKFLTAHYSMMWCEFLLVIANLVCLIFLGATCVPKIWDAFQFTRVTTIFIVFGYSAAIVLRDTHGIATKRAILVSSVMILLVVSSSSVGICSDIYNLFNNAAEA
ncbi:hypothetical protein EJD97_016171 [Solanum chilense]|uniref:Uncharacterized protein n=1 Tax=Solanum chilense TaxID=4083 RepID=A0A6N2B864_SOLCI|nr:hypothetical protein EJD97_016171 [Solanum chilense]